MKILKPKFKKKTFTKNPSVDVFIKVQIFALLMDVLIFALFSYVALISDLPIKYDFLCALVCFAISNFLVGFYTGLKSRQNGLLYGVIYSLPTNVIVILISLILSNFNVSMNIAITALVLPLCAGIGGIVAVNSRLRR